MKPPLKVFMHAASAMVGFCVCIRQAENRCLR